MLNRMRIASKLLIGFGALLLMLAILASFSTYSSVASKSSIEQLAVFKSNEVLDQSALERIQASRMHMWMALGSGDPGHWAKSDEALKSAKERLDELSKNTINPTRRAQAQQLAELLPKFAETVAKFRTVGGQNEYLIPTAGEVDSGGIPLAA
jgi:hypothetical protein